MFVLKLIGIFGILGLPLACKTPRDENSGTSSMLGNVTDGMVLSKPISCSGISELNQMTATVSIDFGIIPLEWGKKWPINSRPGLGIKFTAAESSNAQMGQTEIIRTELDVTKAQFEKTRNERGPGSGQGYKLPIAPRNGLSGECLILDEAPFPEIFITGWVTCVFIQNGKQISVKSKCNDDFIRS